MNTYVPTIASKWSACTSAALAAIFFTLAMLSGGIEPKAEHFCFILGSIWAANAVLTWTGWIGHWLVMLSVAVGMAVFFHSPYSFVAAGTLAFFAVMKQAGLHHDPFWRSVAGLLGLTVYFWLRTYWIP